jgi:hypothetical protein
VGGIVELDVLELIRERDEDVLRGQADRQRPLGVELLAALALAPEDLSILLRVGAAIGGSQGFQSNSIPLDCLRMSAKVFGLFASWVPAEVSLTAVWTRVAGSAAKIASFQSFLASGGKLSSQAFRPR